MAVTTAAQLCVEPRTFLQAGSPESEAAGTRETCVGKIELFIACRYAPHIDTRR